MNAQARLSNLRIAPRKVRLVANALRGMSVTRARVQLQFLMKKSSEPMLKLLNSAVANAVSNLKLDPEKLYIVSIFVNGGQSLRRGVPQSRGRIHPIRKETSHITLTLAEKNGTQTSGAAKKSEKKSEKKAEKKSASKEEKKAPVTKTKKRATGLAKRAFHKHE